MKRIFRRDVAVGAAAAAALAVLCGALTGALWAGLGLGAAVLGCAALTCAALERHICGPVEDGTADFPELSALRARLDEQEARLRESARSLEEKERDLTAIRENMKEGLILMDRRGFVISMNASAGAMLLAEPGDYQGKHIFAVNAHPTLQTAVLTAMGGTPRDELLELSGSAVSIFADPVRVGGEIRGVVLLLFDVTEKLAAEQMRREFTANVSHELKTPLTAVTGYAELLEAGMVQPEDVRGVGASIREESARLLKLIDDILDLSRLDESGAALEREEVDLRALSEEVAERLASAAEKYGVALRVVGESVCVRGNRRLLEEMVTNLAENALKYNHPGGYGEIAVASGPDGVRLTVSDDGIGIAREHQDHIFERFYRVDKSRSKSTGGTGLGLSIVKHGAARHNASVELSSLPGKGTTISILFPPGG